MTHPDTAIDPVDPSSPPPGAATTGPGDEDRVDEPARDEDGRLIVDALGMPCPQPVLELAAAVKELAVGEEVRLLADDQAATVDVPVWCRMRRQQLLAQGSDERGLWFIVRKTREA